MTHRSRLVHPSISQRQQNALKYVTEEWASIEYELLRERGLWGPPIGSHLDKFVLEMTEGPCRMRKKMVRNDMFYIHYPYIPEIEPNTNSAQVFIFKYVPKIPSSKFSWRKGASIIPLSNDIRPKC